MNRQVLTFATVLVTAFQASTAPASPGVETFGVADLASQRLSGESTLIVPESTTGGEIRLLVRVGVDGVVLDAEVLNNFSDADPGSALEAVKGWRFRPQSFDGRPIVAVGTVRVDYKQPEIPADYSVPFPKAAPSDTEVTLERNGCLGSCPDYRVSISGAGEVHFFSSDGSPLTWQTQGKLTIGRRLLWPGTHEAQVSPEAVLALLNRFRDAHFMGLRSEYRSRITDGPAYVLTLRVASVTKRVVDYYGRDVGMPTRVTDLENAVDALAGTRRWVQGTAETIALLKAQGIDFKSKAAATFVQAAMGLNRWSRDHAEVGGMIRAALAEGMNLDTQVSVWPLDGRGMEQTIGSAIAGFAANAGDEALFNQMAEAGSLARMNQHELDEALASGAGCSASIAAALVAAGANPTAKAVGGNALVKMVHAFSDPCANEPPERRLKMARTLLDLGVPLQEDNDSGWTSLRGCNDPELVQMFLGRGANPNLRGDDGIAPVMVTEDDRVAVLLLRAGADPRAVNRWSGTLRQRAIKAHMPATLAWLDSHGVQ